MFEKAKRLNNVFKGISVYFKEHNRIAKANDQRQEALYKESFTIAALRNQLDTVIEEMRSSENKIEFIRIEIDPDAERYLEEACKGLDCAITPHVVQGQYLVSFKEEYL